MVSGLAEIAFVGQTPTQTAQPSGHRAESSLGLPRNRAGVDAAITSGITGCPSANRTTSALGRESLISKLSACGLDSRSVKFLERVDRRKRSGVRRGIERDALLRDPGPHVQCSDLRDPRTRTRTITIEVPNRSRPRPLLSPGRARILE